MTSIDRAKTFSTVQAYIDHLNEDAGCFALADAEHFAEAYGITTPVELEEHLFWGSFSDIYKDANGVRPRSEWTREQAEKWLETTRQFAEWEAEQEEVGLEYERLYGDSERRWQEFTAG